MRVPALLLPTLLGGLTLSLAPVTPSVPHAGAESPLTDHRVAPAALWGGDGHELAARTAVSGLPAEVPAFFREAGEGLVYLNPEPDRWRERALAAMDQAWNYGHYIDLENVPEGSDALDAEHRYEFLRILYEDGVEEPEVSVGFLPFRILELYQRLVTEWRLWRVADARDRPWIELRILNDAGILGHYVTDAAQPHHTTIHFNGWDADAPNPRDFTYARDFHGRFESAFVSAHLGQEDVDAAARPTARSVAGDSRRAIWDHVAEAHGYVERLYELEQDHGFDPDAARPHPELTAFAADRLAAGAEMLRDLWYSAWLESARPPEEG